MRSLLVVTTILFFTSVLSAQEVRLMTYNIKYANENDGENSWSQRKDWLTSQIQFYEPDILGMQEAVNSQLAHFSANIEYYDIVGEGREGKNKGEFSPILYKTSKFKLLKADTFWLSETPDKISKGWDAAYNRICTWALFQERVTEKKFWVFNTHFDHVGEVARLESSKLIVEKIRELNKEDLPVFLMGDLNLESEQEGIQIILDFLNDSKDVSEFSFGPAGTFNGYDFAKPVTRRIDYIFVNGKVKVKKYGVLTDSQDLKYPSDHFPVFIQAKIGE